jgi:hypothetical protein
LYTFFKDIWFKDVQWHKELLQTHRNPIMSRLLC